MRTPCNPSFLLALTAALAIGCGDDGGMPTTGAGDGSNQNTTSGGDDGATGESQTGMGPGGMDNMTMTDDGTMPTTNNMTATDDNGGCPSEPMPDGASCTEDCECQSENCFFIAVLGGVCGECNEDADCEGGGCTIPNPLVDPPTGSVCNDGSAGQGCETSDVCQEGLECGILVEVPSIFTLSTCGECLEDADCAEGQFCSPSIDLASFSGERTCVDPGTVPNGQICDFETTGDMACESGICATVDIMAVVQVGVCGDCEVDADCMDKTMMCAPADIDTDTQEVIPPTCVPIK